MRGVRCASPTIATICASSVSRPTRSARITKLPGAVDRAAGDAAARLLLDRHRLARHHRLVDRARALERRRRRPGLSRPDGRAACRRRAHRCERDIVLPAVARPAAPFSARGRAARGAPRSSGCARAAPAPGRAGRARRSPPRCRSRSATVAVHPEARGKQAGASVAATLNAYAAPTPSAISVNMFGLPVDDRLPTPRSKNGQPAQSTTGVASDEADPVGHADVEPMPSAWAEQHVRHRERRTPAGSAPRRSRTAASCRPARDSAPRRAVIVRGSSAMPQIGHAPGSSRTISGCIGQV